MNKKNRKALKKWIIKKWKTAKFSAEMIVQFYLYLRYCTKKVENNEAYIPFNSWQVNYYYGRDHARKYWREKYWY